MKLATSHARRGDFKSAMRVIGEVKENLGPGDPFVYELGGTVLVMKKDYPGAEAQFKKMLARSPDSVTGRFDLAETIFLQGRYEEAETSFAYLDTLERDSDPALADLCRFKRIMCLLAAGRLDLAAKLLPEQGDPSVGSPAMRYALAAICYSRKDYAEADSIIQEERQEMGEDVENLFGDSFIELRWAARDASGNFHLNHDLPEH